MPVAKTEYITPSRANEIATDVNRKQLYAIFKEIGKAAEQGQYSIEIDVESLTPGLRRAQIQLELNRMNYKVSVSPRSRQFLIISWG